VATSGQGPNNPADVNARNKGPQPGLDTSKHARAQQAAAKGGVIRKGFITASMAAALGSGGHFDPADFEAYLDGLKDELKGSGDPIQTILIEQLAFAHLRLVRLQADAASAKALEAHKILNSACSRLMGEIRRTALTLDALRGKAPAAPRLKLAHTG